MTVTIYKIMKNDTIVYIGSTNNTYQRFASHKQKFHKSIYTCPLYTYMRSHGTWNDYSFDIIEDNIDSTQRLQREKYWIQHYNPVANSVSPIRTKQERIQQVRESYERGKEKYVAHRLEKITCHCGVTYCRGNRIRHENSKYHVEHGTSRSTNTI